MRTCQRRNRVQPSTAHNFEPGPGVSGQKKTIEETRDQLKPGDVFYYYADEFNVSWLPTLRVLWSPKGQQVIIPTPGQPKVYYGLGAVNYHSGEVGT